MTNWTKPASGQSGSTSSSPCASSARIRLPQPMASRITTKIRRPRSIVHRAACFTSSRCKEGADSAMALLAVADARAVRQAADFKAAVAVGRAVVKAAQALAAAAVPAGRAALEVRVAAAAEVDPVLVKTA